MAVLDAELLREMHTEGLHAVALGRVMSGGDESNAAFAREMGRLLELK